jgi:hypothetical protein
MSHDTKRKRENECHILSIEHSPGEGQVRTPRESETVRGTHLLSGREGRTSQDTKRK